MRISRLVVIAGFGLVVAGCTSTNGTTGSTPSAPVSGTTATAPATAGTAASCVAGTWRGTGMSRTGTIVGATVTASGGGGFTVTVGSDGKTVIDFGGMQPIMFTSNVGGTNIKGQYSHGGKVNGTVRAVPTTDTTGTWEPVGTVDWSQLTITVDLTSPVQAKVFDNQKIADFTGSGVTQTGQAVDVQPILRKGTYDCSGSTLKIGPESGTSDGTTWTLEKA